MSQANLDVVLKQFADTNARDISGVPVEERWAYLYTVRDGKVCRVELWADRDAREAALTALGRSE
jgi:ketosteroid isomerase-like protein